LVIIGRGGGSFEDLFAFNDESLARAIYACEKPIVSAVGHEVDYTVCDFVADLRVPTPSAAAEICIPKKEDIEAYINGYRQKIGEVVSAKIAKSKLFVNQALVKLERNSPTDRLLRIKARLSLLKKNIADNAEFKNKQLQLMLSEQKLRLTALSPQKVLTRGFSYITDGKGYNITSVHAIDIGSKFTATFADGSVEAKVLAKKEGKDHE